MTGPASGQPIDEANYRCGTCGTNGLRIVPADGAWCATSGTWRVECGNGHVVQPLPGSEIVIPAHFP